MSRSIASQELTDRFAAPSSNRQDLGLIALLVLCTLALYLRVCHFDFVAYDDHLYVYSNIHVEQGLTPKSIRWALTAVPNGNWHPLTTLVQVMISNFFGLHPGAYHTANILLHVLNVALLYIFLRRSTGEAWPAFLASLLWGVHPLRVESVAWVSELKDVLCGAFWLGCMLAYLWYSSRRTVGRLAIVVLLQALSLLSKPMAVTLPAALLLLDYWPLRGSEAAVGLGSAVRWWSFRVLEKLPMVLLSVVDTLRQQHDISLNSTQLTLMMRIENGLISYAMYLRDTFFPYHLGTLYPHPIMFRQPGQHFSMPLLAVGLSGAVVLTISLLVAAYGRGRPYLVVGWCWFLGTLVPVIGLVQVGEQARADRFTYLPSIGIIVAVVWLCGDLVDRVAINRMICRRAGLVAGLVAAGFLAAVSSVDIGYWRNTDLLFSHLLEIQPNNYLALAMTSDHLTDEHQLDQAVTLSSRAIALAPFSPRAHNSYGNALRVSGQLEKAAYQFQIATGLDPGEAAAWDALGRVRDAQANKLGEKRDPAETGFRARAVADFRNAVKAEPDQPDYYEHLAYQLALQGQIDQAIPIWEQAVEMDPKYAQAQGDLADALLVKAQIAGAIEHYQAALAGGLKNPNWETKLAFLLATDPQRTLGEIQPMIAIAKDACDQTHSQDADALDAYAVCLARVGVFDLAIDAAKQAVVRANAAHNSALAKAIQKRLALYEQGKPYVTGDDMNPTSNPTSRPG